MTTYHDVANVMLEEVEACLAVVGLSHARTQATSLQTTTLSIEDAKDTEWFKSPAGVKPGELKMAFPSSGKIEFHWREEPGTT